MIRTILILLFPVFAFGQQGMLLVSSPADGLLLDDYSGASAAYSVRLLRTGADSCMVIRRSSDDATTLIGFSGNDIDESAITTFCSGTDCFVVRWCDQSGNGNDAVQATAAYQPQIAENGVVVKENEKAALSFDGSNYLGISGVNQTPPTDITVAAIRSFSTYPLNYATLFNWRLYGITYADEGAVNYADMHVFKASNASGLVSDYPKTTGQSIDFVYNTESVHRNGVNQTVTAGGNYSVGVSAIGSWKNLSQTFEGGVQSIIIWESDQSSNRTGIETNINNYFSIY